MIQLASLTYIYVVDAADIYLKTLSLITNMSAVREINKPFIIQTKILSKQLNKAINIKA